MARGAGREDGRRRLGGRVGGALLSTAYLRTTGSGRSTIIGARPRLSSSSSSRRGSRTSARATASICCSPPESRPVRRRHAGDRPRAQHRDSRRAAPLAAHRPRPRQGALREGGRLQPRRARAPGLRRALHGAVAQAQLTGAASQSRRPPASRAFGGRAVVGAAVGPLAGGGRVLSPDTASDSASSV
jgi:hypothetical protein